MNRKPDNRKSSLLALCVAVSLTLSACAPQSLQPTPGEAESGETKLTLVLDYVPNTNHTGIYVAKSLGYYADEGLDVEVVQPPDDGADVLVGSGRAELGVSYQDWMANYLGSADPLPVTAIAAIVQHNTSGILSRAGDGIDSAAGLTGKRYGTLDVDTEKAIVESIVTSDGGNWGTVEVVPANSTDEVSGLRSGMFDAIWGFEGWAVKNAEAQGYPIDYFSIRGIDDTFDYYTPVIIANDGWLAGHADDARAFLKATQAGYEYAVEHPAEAAKILVEAAPEISADLAAASQEFLAGEYISDAPCWGYIDPARWNRFYEWMNEQGLTPKPIPLDAAFTNEYLPGL